MIKPRITKAYFRGEYFIRFTYNGITKELLLSRHQENEYTFRWYLYDSYWQDEFWIMASDKLKDIREYLKEEFHLY